MILNKRPFRIDILVYGLLTIAIYGYIAILPYKADPDSTLILGSLKDVNSITEYFRLLLSFQTLDFQPIRDLSFGLDRILGFNSYVLINLCLWICSLFYVNKCIDHVGPEMRKESKLLILLAFCAYPLFASTLAWGMARKHLLSFMFLLISTEKIMRPQFKAEARDIFWICVFYTLAIFSQPIGILWPIWATMYHSELKKNLLKLAIPLFIIALIGYLLNSHYYSVSSVFLEKYPSKTADFFNFSGQLLALGHYVTVLILPYFPSFQFQLGHWSTLSGLVFIVFILAALYRLKFLSRTKIWLLYFILPLIPVLMMPEMLQDTYLLLPAFAALMILIEVFKTHTLSTTLALLTIIAWATISFSHTLAWRSNSALMNQSYQNAPSCITAFSAAKIDLVTYKPVNPEVMTYLRDYQCLEHLISSKQNLIDAQYVQAMILFHDDHQPVEERLRILKEGGLKGNHYAATYFTALLLKEKRFEEAQPFISDITLMYSRFNFSQYDGIIEHYILPYCQMNQNAECIRVFSPFTKGKIE